MKVLLATTDSKNDESATQFVARAHWPLGSEIEVLGILEPPAPGGRDTSFGRRLRELEGELRFIAEGLPLHGWTASWRCVVGSPAGAIGEAARAMNADLIVMGTRSRGGLTAALLGSVSAGVIDGAPCPVLVARTATADRIVLADDGSVGAAAAAALVQEWSLFTQSAVSIVSVVPASRPEERDEEIAVARITVAERAHPLAGREHPVEMAVREGPAAHEIIAAAGAFDADLIVVGSRGLTGLARLVAGSVARDVVRHAPCSVLVVRSWAAIARADDLRRLALLARA